MEEYFELKVVFAGIKEGGVSIKGKRQRYLVRPCDGSLLCNPFPVLLGVAVTRMEKPATDVLFLETTVLRHVEGEGE
jgi:hypothetical protein